MANDWQQFRTKDLKTPVRGVLFYKLINGPDGKPHDIKVKLQYFGSAAELTMFGVAKLNQAARTFAFNKAANELENKLRMAGAFGVSDD